MKKRWQGIAKHWRFVVVPGVALGGLCSLYLFRLGSLTNRLLSLQEMRSVTANAHLHNALDNPLNAPFKALEYLFLHFAGHNAAFARMAAVLFALLASVLFFAIAQRWHGKRGAILATILFCTSGWLLHVGRLSTADVLPVLVPLALILLASRLATTTRPGLALLCMSGAAGLLLFTPGAVWFVLAAAVLLRKSLLETLKQAAPWQAVLSAAFVLACAGALGFAIYRDLSLLRPWLGVPAQLPAPLTIAKQWVETLTFLFVRGPYAPDMWLAHTPILDVFTAVMCVLGGYFYATHYRNLRTQVLAAFLILGSLLVALNGVAEMSYVVPIAYLLAATGLTFLLHKWLTVFPRNPVARIGGVALLVAVVAFAATYHVTSYFVAWRHSPATISTFRERP